MSQDRLAQKIWQENELTVLARSRQAYEETLAVAQSGEPEKLFPKLARVYRLPAHNWSNAALYVWQALHADFSGDRAEFENHLAALTEPQRQTHAREALRLWLWRRVVRSGRQDLIASRFFADEHLFHRTLQEDRLIFWYAGRVAEWPIQLLLGVFLGGEETKRLRLQLYWPTANLPANLAVSRAENRVLRRLWEARILVRFGNWAHLHPAIILLLPEISFTAPVFAWRGRELVAHVQDGRTWPISPFHLAALLFDEALALFGRDRRGWWRNFTAYAESYLARPEDAASQFVLQCFDDWGLHLVREAEEDFLKEFAESIRLLEQLRVSI
jgi:hypothetical protein